MHYSADYAQGLVNCLWCISVAMAAAGMDRRQIFEYMDETVMAEAAKAQPASIRGGESTRMNGSTDLRNSFTIGQPFLHPSSQTQHSTNQPTFLASKRNNAFFHLAIGTFFSFTSSHTRVLIHNMCL